MNDKQTEIFSTEINSESGLESLHKKLEELKPLGLKELTVKIFSATIDIFENLGIDKDLFEQIKEKQALPDEVVADFLKSKGSLPDNNYIARIKW